MTRIKYATVGFAPSSETVTVVRGKKSGRIGFRPTQDGGTFDDPINAEKTVELPEEMSPTEYDEYADEHLYQDPDDPLTRAAFEVAEEHGLDTGSWDVDLDDVGPLDDLPTTTRGRSDYPVPGAWVLGAVGGDGAIWHFFPRLADEETKNVDEIEVDEALPGPAATAFLQNEVIEEGEGFDGDLLPVYRLEIDDTDVFRVRDAEYSDVIEAVGEALDELAGGAGVDGLDVDVAGGTAYRPPAEKRDEERRQEIEKRREENASLGEWL